VADNERAQGGRTVAQNRRARFDYAIEDTFEAGIVLVGTEVKSLRRGQASIGEAYASDQGGELYLLNAHIAPYDSGKTFGHEPRRPRKLLLHRREIGKMIGAIRREGMTLVPLSIYFDARGRAKVSLALAKGRRKADQRQAVKDRDWQRQRSRLLRTSR
jgi:SsrA-binding protein